jgi:hypothetical protein
VHLKIRSRELWQFQVDGYNVPHDFNLGVVFACKNSGKCKNPNDNRLPSEKKKLECKSTYETMYQYLL